MNGPVAAGGAARLIESSTTASKWWSHQQLEDGKHLAAGIFFETCAGVL